MRAAAKSAVLLAHGGKIALCLEPEVAILRTAVTTNLIKHDHRALVLDMGNGTVDWVAFQVSQAAPGSTWHGRDFNLIVSPEGRNVWCHHLAVHFIRPFTSCLVLILKACLDPTPTFPVISSRNGNGSSARLMAHWMQLAGFLWMSSFMARSINRHWPRLGSPKTQAFRHYGQNVVDNTGITSGGAAAVKEHGSIAQALPTVTDVRAWESTRAATVG